MAQDIGFLSCPYGTQLFHPRIDETAFQRIIDEFGLRITRHDPQSPYVPIQEWLTKWLRMEPPPSPPDDEEIPFYRRQMVRFQQTADLILEHELLASDIEGSTRRNTFKRFKARLRNHADWPLTHGY